MIQKGAEDRAWKCAKEAHQEAVKAWEVETRRLKEARVPKKNWPMKPKCARKNMVIVAIKLSELIEDSEEEEEDHLELVLDGSDSEDGEGDEE